MEKIENMEIILHENEEWFSDEHGMLKCSSTVAIKFVKDGETYGVYKRIDKSFLNAADVVEAVNVLLKEAERWVYGES